jgi:hypothetical protein
MSLFSLQCPSIGCYTNYQCDPEFLNKVVAVAYVNKSYNGINKTTPALWQETLLEAYVAGQAFIVFNVSGEKPKPDTATTSGRGMQTTKALAKTHTVNYTDMQGVVYGNVEWYNDMLSNSSKYDFYYFTPNRIWDASGYYVTVIGDPVITAELNTYQMADVSVQWVSKVNPLPYEFDTDTFLEGLYFIITNVTNNYASNAFTFTNTEGCDSLVLDFSAALNVSGVTPQYNWSIIGATLNQAGNYEIDNWIGTGDGVFNFGGGTSEETTITLLWENVGSGSFFIQVATESGCVIGQQEIFVNNLIDCS